MTSLCTIGKMVQFQLYSKYSNFNADFIYCMPLHTSIHFLHLHPLLVHVHMVLGTLKSFVSVAQTNSHFQHMHPWHAFALH